MNCAHGHGIPHVRNSDYSDENYLKSVKKYFSTSNEIIKMKHGPDLIPFKKKKLREQKAHKKTVFDRLTDANFYTGIHKQKFEKLNSRIITRKETNCNFDPSNFVRKEKDANEHYACSTLEKNKCFIMPVVIPGTLGMQKYGIQIARPKYIWLFRNGDKNHNGLLFLVKPYIHNWKSLLIEITKVLDPIMGPVRKIYNTNFSLVKTFAGLNDGEKYLCTSGEPPACIDRLDRFLSPWVMHS
ncbi:apicortin [Plasmodium gonderi]|uniref:Apicortin n=1 Tax=Plasmodium gonderi TaxID=77519 RepID=A0A1Y1JGK7_PLAGO|nr:apicortin [Plasmodium gonderi]GAW81380.1 apicortin [Plasmodium gonderi]